MEDEIKRLVLQIEETGQLTPKIPIFRIPRKKKKYLKAILKGLTSKSHLSIKDSYTFFINSRNLRSSTLQIQENSGSLIPKSGEDLYLEYIEKHALRKAK